jgi:hypothetical protein
MMADFDERHYVTPRGDRSPGVLHVNHEGRWQLGTVGWLSLAVVLAFCVLVLWTTECGEGWCW